MKDGSGALSLFKKVTASQGVKDSPKTAAAAYHQIYLFYLGQKMRPARERVISECCKLLPEQPQTATICELEGDNRLLDDDPAKAELYYNLAGKGISKTGSDVLYLLTLPRSGLKTAPVSSDETDKLVAVAREKADCALKLCDLFSKRERGWLAVNTKARIYVYLEQYDAAIALWQSMLKAKQGSVDTIELAIAETTGFKKGDFKSAVPMYEAWVKRYPHSESIEDGEYQQAGALWMSGSYDGAVAKFIAFLKKYPGTHYKEHAQSTLARATADSKARQEAIAKNEKAKANTDPLADDLIAAESKMRQGDYASALKILGRFRGKQSTNSGWGHAWYCYGLCLRMLGEPEKALQSFEAVTRHADLFKSTLYASQCRRAIADLWFEGFAKPEKALPVYREIKASLPEDKPDLALEKSIALALIALGRGAEAKPALMKFRQQELNDPFRTRYWDGLIALCDAPAEVRGIKTEIEREAATYSRVADIHFAAENWEKAEYLYKKSQKTAPKSETAAFATMQTARCQAYQNERDRALKTYNLFLSTYSESQWADDALLKAGVLCTGPMGDSGKGAKYFQKIVDDHPKGDRAETAFYYLATLALWGQNWEVAERLHKEFLQKFPKSLFVKEVINDRLPAIAKKKIFLDEPKKNTES